MQHSMKIKNVSPGAATITLAPRPASRVRERISLNICMPGSVQARNIRFPVTSRFLLFGEVIVEVGDVPDALRPAEEFGLI